MPESICPSSVEHPSSSPRPTPNYNRLIPSGSLTPMEIGRLQKIFLKKSSGFFLNVRAISFVRRSVCGETRGKKFSLQRDQTRNSEKEIIFLTAAEKMRKMSEEISSEKKLFIFLEKKPEVRLGVFLERFDSRRQARQLAGGRFLVEDSLGDAAVELGAGGLEGGFGGLRIAGGDGSFNFFHEAADARLAGAIDVGAARVAADSFLSGYVSCHFIFFSSLKIFHRAPRHCILSCIFCIPNVCP
jgi:hypothetical protein